MQTLKQDRMLQSRYLPSEIKEERKSIDGDNEDDQSFESDSSIDEEVEKIQDF
jgi:hypothetical protein